MTNEEAIEYLKQADTTVYKKIKSKTAEALEIAIQALEQQPCEDCVNRSELQKTMDSLPLFRFVNNDHEEADDYYNCESVDMVIRNLPSVTPRRDLAETSQDCISREEVQDLISRWLSDYLLDETREALETINCKVGDMPSVIPQMKKGRWIDVLDEKTEYSETHHFECSICGCGSHWTHELEKFCPNCGAEMSGGGEDEADKDG